MRILYLSPRQCWPTTSGAKLRDFYLARALGESGDLSYVYFAQDAALTSRELPFCRDLVGIPKPRPYTPSKLLKGLVSRQPLTVINYSSADMAGALTRLAAGGSFDIIHIDSPHMASYVHLLTGGAPTRVVYSWHNIESELLYRYAANTTSLPRRLYASLTAQRLARLEGDMLQNGFGHLVCSEREQLQLLKLMPSARIAVIENGVDTETITRTETAVRNRIVFVGLMSYVANAEAAVWFAQDVWPSLHARYPAWTLTLVGADPLPSVQALRSIPGIEVTGTVPDVRRYYSEARMAIVPLRTGAGTRLKILEAMAAGVPVVSTALGAEGLQVTPGDNLLIAENEADWLEACARLAVQNELERTLTDSARQLVSSRYDWRVIGKQLVKTYQQWLGDN